jgi:non-ribosomal peptide synthetase component E (peptide arylation enzyme)
LEYGANDEEILEVVWPEGSACNIGQCRGWRWTGRALSLLVVERASAILFDNLKGNRCRCAVTGSAGSRAYGELAADASALGAGLLSLGLGRGDRVLLFLYDTPIYPAALFGAIRAGLVPLLINTLTPPDLLQFYLAEPRWQSVTPPSPIASMLRPAGRRTLKPR